MCEKAYHKAYRSNPENKGKIKEINKKYNAKPGVKESRRAYRDSYDNNADNKAKRNEYLKEYRARPENKERAKRYREVYDLRPENKETKKAYNATAKAKEGMRRSNQKRRVVDALFDLKCKLRTLIGMSIKGHGYSKRSKTFQLLSVDFETVKNYLEYTWFQNYGTEYCGQKVHIDHIIPCASAKTEEGLLALQHWTNLQYLTPEDNLIKGAWIPLEQ